MYYHNGNKYEGEWKNGIKHGKGIFYFKNGAKYEGIFICGKCENGTLTVNTKLNILFNEKLFDN